MMQLDGVRHNLGMHSTEIEAARAYDRFARVRDVGFRQRTNIFHKSYRFHYRNTTRKLISRIRLSPLVRPRHLPRDIFKPAQPSTAFPTNWSKVAHTRAFYPTKMVNLLMEHIPGMGMQLHCPQALALLPRSRMGVRMHKSLMKHFTTAVTTTVLTRKVIWASSFIQLGRTMDLRCRLDIRIGHWFRTGSSRSTCQSLICSTRRSCSLNTGRVRIQCKQTQHTRQ